MRLFKVQSARTCAAALCAAAVLSGSRVGVANGTPVAVAAPDDGGGGPILELDVTNLPDLKEGQPAVAINPTKPNNLVFTATIFNPPTAPFPQNLMPPGECYLAYSMDKGRSWTRVPWPLGDRPQCGEPNVAVDAEGTFYILANQLGCPSDVSPEPVPGFCNLNLNQVVVSRSVDGGRTWSGPVETPLRLSGGPKLRVDVATGRVYAVGGFDFQYPSGVSVSADGGQSWGPAQLLPGPLTSCVVVSGASRCGYPGRELAVHDGILATATQDVPLAGTPTGVVKFWVSVDEGQTWDERTVTDSAGNAVPAGVGLLLPRPVQGAGADPLPWISADPTQSGRFAVMVPRAPVFDSDQSNPEVYVSEDAGQSWTGPAVIAAPDARRPWMDFGSSGYLGVMWRTDHSVPGGSTATAVDAFAAVSFDHGRSFSEPLRVNSTTQPLGSGGPPGDRWSFITLDRSFAYVTWSDGRGTTSGGLSLLDGILSRVPLGQFRGTR